MSLWKVLGIRGLQVLAWAYPEEEIIYVFFSNRTYPDSTNNRLLDANIRTEIQSLIYQAITD